MAQSWSAPKDDKRAKRDARSLTAAKPAVALSVVELVIGPLNVCWTRVLLNREMREYMVVVGEALLPKERAVWS